MTPKKDRLLRVLRLTSWLVASGVVAAQQPSPVFKSSVEVTSLDATVVDAAGKPVANLTPADFNVRIDGSVRRVVSAQWVSLVGDGAAPTPPSPPEGYSTNESSVGGRLIVIAIDQPNIRFGGAIAVAKAANGFVDRLQSSDRVAVAGIGLGAPSTAFTGDRTRTKRTIERMVGQRSTAAASNQHSIGISEAMAIDRGDTDALNQLQQRECSSGSVGARDAEVCRLEVETEARAMARDAQHGSDETIAALRDLLAGLRLVDAPKTLILISEGFVVHDQSLVSQIGAMAAAARTSLYALRLDNQLFDIASARPPSNAMNDRQALGEGLETLASAARGALFTVTGNGQALFDRIQTELSGYYQLGVESDPKDRDGKPHPIRVDVPRRGAIVRSRRQLLNTPADTVTARNARSPRRMMTAALHSPLIASALPLRVTSFALQGPERDKVQLLIHADIGADYPAPRVVSVGYVISDQNGKQVENKTFDVRANPLMNGVPSSLQYTAGASLPSGTYTLKLAVAEGERVGTVEHEIRAALSNAAGMSFSDLMAGGPSDPGELLTPTIGYQVIFGMLHGYVEAYGSTSSTVTAEYEVAATLDSPALLNVDVPMRAAGDDRAIFSAKVPVNQLPPGPYVLRAIFSEQGKAVKTLTRTFEIAAPKVLLTSAEGLGATSVDSELFLPVDEAKLARSFSKAEAIRADTLDQFRDRIPDRMRPTFDQGVASLGAGDYPKAEAAFKAAIDADLDSTVPLAYLAAAFASAGHETEASSAWQTALIDGTEFPQIYQWLADSLMRVRDLGGARTILEEAVGKWPSDPNFTRPLALLYGTFGRGREAVRTLEHYLAVAPDDRDALFLGVQWIYTVHAEGAFVQTRADDVKVAHSYAQAYEKAAGPQVALVKQWIDFLDNEGKK